MREAVLQAPALDPRFRAHLRLVEANAHDAVFTHRLRANPDLNRHLNVPTTALDDQKRWLEAYKTREAQGREFYFIVVHEGTEAGVIRLYDFHLTEPTSFVWGSWIIPPPRPAGLVTLSLIMALEVGFDALGLQLAHSSVRKGNSRVIAFHLRAGARQVGEDDEQFHYVISLETYRRMQAESAERYAQLRGDPA